MFELVDEVKRALDERLHPDGYNIGINAGEAAGQTVPHLHVHVIPRYRGDVDDPRGGVRHVIPGKGNYLASDPRRLATGGEADPFLDHLKPSSVELRTTCTAGTNFVMKRDELLDFLRAQPWAVEASVTGVGEPQAAVVGVAVTNNLELVFDTLGTSRKAVNLRANPRIALVVGWDDGQTAQIEGVTDEPVGAERQRVKDAYLRRFPDGHERAALPDITYFRVLPRWIRYSDFRTTPPIVVVFEGDLKQPSVEGASK